MADPQVVSPVAYAKALSIYRLLISKNWCYNDYQAAAARVNMSPRAVARRDYMERMEVLNRRILANQKWKKYFQSEMDRQKDIIEKLQFRLAAEGPVGSGADGSDPNGAVNDRIQPAVGSVAEIQAGAPVIVPVLQVQVCLQIIEAVKLLLTLQLQALILPANLQTTDPQLFFVAVRSELKDAHAGKDNLPDAYIEALKALQTALDAAEEESATGHGNAKRRVWLICTDLHDAAQALAVQVPNQLFEQHHEFVLRLTLVFFLMEQFVCYGEYNLQQVSPRVEKLFKQQDSGTLVNDVRSAYDDLTGPELTQVKKTLANCFRQTCMTDKALLRQCDAFITQMPDMGAGDLSCVCDDPMDGVPKVLACCNGVVHPQCLMKWWIVGASKQAIRCPHCAHSYADAVENVAVQPRVHPMLQQPVQVQNESSQQQVELMQQSNEVLQQAFGNETQKFPENNDGGDDLDERFFPDDLQQQQQQQPVEQQQQWNSTEDTSNKVSPQAILTAPKVEDNKEEQKEEEEEKTLQIDT